MGQVTYEVGSAPKTTDAAQEVDVGGAESGQRWGGGAGSMQKPETTTGKWHQTEL